MPQFRPSFRQAWWEWFPEECYVSGSPRLIELTGDIVVAYLAGNRVGADDIPALIRNVYAALDAPRHEAEPAEVPQPKRPMSIRASIKHDHLLSMLDGKPYKSLRRHLTTNGYTPERYREAFGLPADYPMVAAAYSEQRRALAKSIGLGRKRAVAAVPPSEAAPASPAKRSRRTLKLAIK
ncbi:MAG: MucR family transcriptional regulator [Sphingopyxis sp.]|nr:MucR family transcriptional regulator [Sphingopyxis sp.]